MDAMTYTLGYSVYPRMRDTSWQISRFQVEIFDPKICHVIRVGHEVSRWVSIPHTQGILQGGPLPVVNGVITPINDLING